MLVATVQNSVACDVCTPVLCVVHGWPSGTGAGFPPPVRCSHLTWGAAGCYRDCGGRGPSVCLSVCTGDGATVFRLLVCLWLAFPVRRFDYYYYYYYCRHHHLYAGYLQLHTWTKPCFYGIQCCSCFVFTVCATCNVISPMQYVLYLYISASRSMCAVPNMWLFSVVPWLHVLPVCCSRIFRMTLK